MEAPVIQELQLVWGGMDGGGNPDADPMPICVGPGTPEAPNGTGGAGAGIPGIGACGLGPGKGKGAATVCRLVALSILSISARRSVSLSIGGCASCKSAGRGSDCSPDRLVPVQGAFEWADRVGMMPESCCDGTGIVCWWAVD